MGRLEAKIQTINERISATNAQPDTATTVNDQVDALEAMVQQLEINSVATAASTVHLTQQIEMLTASLTIWDTTLKQGMDSQFTEIKDIMTQLAQTMGTVGD